MGRPRKGWSLRPPKDGRGHYTVRFTDKAGTPREYSTGESDPQAAAKRAAEIYARDLTAPAASGPRVSPHLALDEHMAQWLASLENTHDPETVKTYTAHARRFVRFFGDSISRITAPRMGEYCRMRLGEVLRITVKKERSTLNVFLSWCVESEILAEEHVPRWPKLPKKALGVRTGPQRAAPVDVTPAQVNAFLAALPQWSKRGKNGAPSFPIRSRFVVAYETGLRPATLDVLAMPKHWRPGATEIQIEDQIDKARFGRKVPISARAAAELERVVLALGLKEGPIFGAHDYRTAVERARVAAGLPEDFAPYDLRHARAGHLLDAGGAMRAVAHLLGHKKLTTTDRYLRAQEGEARLALQGAAEAAGFGGDSGDGEGSKTGPEMLDQLTHQDHGAKEGGRTPTSVRTLVPESSGSVPTSNTYEHLQGLTESQNAPSGPGFGDAPETQAPDSLIVAARFLGVLRASDEAFERLLAEEMISGDAEEVDP